MYYWCREWKRGYSMDAEWKRELKECGVDVDMGIKAHMGNESMYERILKLVLLDENFGLLFSAIETNDSVQIFEISHSLKGTLGNVGLIELDRLVTDICEVTRKGSNEGVRENSLQLKESYEKIMECFLQRA